MGKRIPQLKQGSVVIAPIVPDAGRIKPRPAIVLTPTASIETDSLIEVIGVTASYFPDESVYVELPFTSDGRGPTRFAKPCAAKLTLVQQLPKVKVWPTDGYLPRKALDDLIRRLKEYVASLGPKPP